MNEEKLEELKTRTLHELDEIRRVLPRIHSGWEHARRFNDDFYVESVALNLHGFYMGFERIFAHIAEVVDDNMPQGEKWHLKLLRQMTKGIPAVRPAVISPESGDMLDDYRGFRHVVRNVYTHHLDPSQVGKLVASVPILFEKLNAELLIFISFLEGE